MADGEPQPGADATPFVLASVALGTFDRAALQSLDWSFLVFFGAVLTVGRLGATRFSAPR